MFQPNATGQNGRWRNTFHGRHCMNRFLSGGRMLLFAMLLANGRPGGAAPVMIIEGSDWLGSRCESPLAMESGRSLDLSIPPGVSAWVRLRFASTQAYLVRASGGGGDVGVSLASACSSKAEPMGWSTGKEGEAAIRADEVDATTVRVTNHGADVVTATLSATGVVFVSGRVTSEEYGSPLARVEVRALALDGLRTVGSTYTDDFGNYQLLLGPSDAGSGFFLRTGEDFHVRYLHEAWPNAACTEPSSNYLWNCEPGTPLHPAPGTGLSSIDFALGRGATLEGRILDAVTGLPVPHAWIEVHSSTSWQRYRTVEADEAGRYRAVGFKPGPIRLRAWSYEYEGELHQDIPCPYEGCLLDPGAVVELSSARPTTVDFNLNPSSYIDVALTVEGAPVTSPTLFIVVGADGVARYFQEGGSRLGPLSPGTYYVSAQAGGVSFDQVYDGVECDPWCSVERIPQVGTPIVIANPGDRPRIRMDLRRLPALAGRVTNARGEPVAGAMVSVSLDGSAPRAGARTDEQGNYVVRGIWPGDYYVFVDATDYVDQLHPAVDCESESAFGSCAGASKISFQHSTVSRSADFVLQDAPRIHGSITVLGQPAAALWWGWERSFRLVRSDGTEVAGTMARIDAFDSTFELTDYPPGTYYVRASVAGHYDQLADGKDCIFEPPYQFACPLADARLYTLGTQDVRIDFDLTPLGQRVVVQDPQGNPLSGIALDLWNADGHSLGTIGTGADGWAVLPRHDEPVSLSTDNARGFLDELYRDITCPRGTSVYRGGCSLEGSTPLSLQYPAAAAAPVVITLEPDPTVFLDDFEGSR
jgi:protocatechuate 3,4-dioxygenase beta subunit